MAKYISYKTGDTHGYIHIPDDDSKAYWLACEPTLQFSSIGDEDYAKALWMPVKIEAGEWAFDDVKIEDGSEYTPTITESDFNAEVSTWKKRCKKALKGRTNLPSHYDNGISAINAFNPTGITFPVTAKNWMKVCIDNGFTIPFIREIV